LSALVVLGGVLLLASCGKDAATTAGTSTTTVLPEADRLAMVRGMCDMDRYVRAGDAVRARAAFYEKAHTGIHEVLALTQRLHPALSTELETAHDELEHAWGYLFQDPDVSAEVRRFDTAMARAERKLGIVATCP
jgi:hypothetical protein